MLNNLYKKDEQIFRCIDEVEDKILVIDCIKRSLPCWTDRSYLDGFSSISEEEFLKAVKVELPRIGDLTKQQLKVMHLRFASISSCITKITNEVERRLMTYSAALDYEVSIQTIRHRLCDYLAFQNILILAPRRKNKRELSTDEKNYRWALNKYFYTSKKLSLRQAYKYLISEKYTNDSGKIVETYPKFHQFKYFYYKTRSESNFIISRMGRGEYDRNFRPLLGEGVRDFCPTIGYGMIDSTTCDIYLVNDSGELIGRPILTACIDAYSSLCLGYSLGWEGGINSLRCLMKNIVTDKVAWCKKYGIEISKDDWNCSQLPHKFITDMGKEYSGEVFSQLTDLGIEIINLKPYRPELKSLVERFFGLVQESFKKELINKGVVLKDFGDRGAIDYRKNACLTLDQFERVLLLCILHYNTGRVIELPYEKRNIKSHARDLWNVSLQSQKDMLVDVDEDLLAKTLLPRCDAVFRRDGLIVNKLRYRAPGFVNEYIRGKEAVVAYDPKNVSHIWLIKDGDYIEFELIEQFFGEKSFEEIDSLRRGTVKEDLEELESEVKLSRDINRAVSGASGKKVRLKNIRKNRKNEIKDYE